MNRKLKTFPPHLDAAGELVVERIDEREFFDMSDLVAPEFGPGDPNIVIEPKPGQARPIPAPLYGRTIRSCAPTVDATRSADGTFRVKP